MAVYARKKTIDRRLLGELRARNVRARSVNGERMIAGTEPKETPQIGKAGEYRPEPVTEEMKRGRESFFDTNSKVLIEALAKCRVVLVFQPVESLTMC